MNDNFDESILKDEKEFKKRFRRIERPAFVDKVVKSNKNRITIMLDPDVIQHFKGEAERLHIGYQTLINQTLRDIINGPKSSDPIEKLLKDKKALKRLKRELEAV
ncbi:MAG: BrnA antitoxin family protein [Chloracidobacterium sp.]|nr:BrnA antitoxin family protein [Chloracidobacterium sp.]